MIGMWRSREELRVNHMDIKVEYISGPGFHRVSYFHQVTK